jgi:hypothetical protein
LSWEPVEEKVLNHPGKDKDGREYGIRDTLFRDLPFSTWPEGDNLSLGEPWDTLAAAIKRLTAIAITSRLESRHIVHASHLLRALGVAPPDGEAQEVYVAVVEGTPEEGTDIVAAYADHTARYCN